MITWFRSFITATARWAWGPGKCWQRTTTASSVVGGVAKNLPQKRVQVATAKGQSKNKWLIDSSATEQRTQPGWTFKPQYDFQLKCAYILFSVTILVSSLYQGVKYFGTCSTIKYVYIYHKDSKIRTLFHLPPNIMVFGGNWIFKTLNVF